MNKMAGDEEKTSATSSSAAASSCQSAQRNESKGGETSEKYSLPNGHFKKQHQASTSYLTAMNSKHRTTLPAKMIDRSQISIWSILKQFIGKELSKIAMPAALCEPLSFLQRITENVYYSDLLNKACDPNISTNACKRMEFIAAYAVSSISSNIDRLSKPFNPLLGETYELTRDDLGFRVVCEQVSHHPPISAFCAESTSGACNWQFYGTVNPKIKFWGKSIEVQPKGLLTLELKKFNEVYTWNTVTCCVHNIIVGKLWFEYYGTMEITCHQSGYKAIINFKPYSWSNKELHKFEGFIYDNKKNKIKALYGYWTHCVYSCDPRAYDELVKSGKPLPMVKLDEYFNEIGAPSTINSARHNQSDPSLHNSSDSVAANGGGSGAGSGAGFNLNDTSAEQDAAANFYRNKISPELDQQQKNLTKDVQRKLSLKRNEPTASTFASFPTSANAQLPDLFEVWRVVPRPAYASEYYSFNYFTMTLNELKPEFEKLIAPTDSRFRTDIRKLELGDLDGASEEKTRLEEKQRENRKGKAADFKGKWFQLGKHQITGEEMYLFTNKYWQRDYSDCLDLY